MSKKGVSPMGFKPFCLCAKDDLPKKRQQEFRLFCDDQLILRSVEVKLFL